MGCLKNWKKTAEVAREQGARGSMTADKGSQDMPKSVVLIQRTMGHHWRA